MVIGDLQDEDGRPGRGVTPPDAARQLERAAERGCAVLAATELEFFLFKDTYE